MTTSTLLQNRAIQRTVLKNGIVVLVVENPAADIIAARVFVRGGSRWESQQQTGLSHLVSAVMTKGTHQRSSLDIAEQVESVGASLGTDSTSDYFLLSFKTVSADFAEILTLAGELLRSPTFPIEEVELERRLTLQAIRSQQEQPFAVALDQLRQTMYGQHPYAASGLGTEETVAQLTQQDLQQYHQTHFRPDNIVISIAGRIVAAEAIALLETVLGDWQAPSTPLPMLSLPEIDVSPTQVITPQETQQSIVMLGYLAPSVNPVAAPHLSDYAALKLLNTYLGNGLSSRLFVELREKRGLAYEVSAFYPTRLETSQFVAYMGTASENTSIALAGLKTEVDRLSSTQLSSEELQSAKNKLLGQYALGKQTNSQLAQVYGWYETLGLGVEFDSRFQQEIAAITPEVAQKAAVRYLLEPYISVLGPAAIVEAL